jgi:hypothetical protein
MLTEITKRSGKLAEGVRQMVEQRMQLALGRFSQRIRRVSVHFSDVTINGGSDKQCRLRIALIPSGVVVVEDIAPSVVAALTNVAERAVQSVGRALGRRPEYQVAPERVIFIEPRRCGSDDQSARRQSGAWSGWVDQMVLNSSSDITPNSIPARFEIGPCGTN